MFKKFARFFLTPIAYSSLKTSLTLFFRIAIQAVTLLCIARILDLKSFGVFTALASLAVLMGTLSTCGTHLMALKEASRSRENLIPILAYAFPTTIITGGTLVALYFLVSLLLLNFQVSLASLFLLIGITELVITPLLQLRSSDLQSQNQVSDSQWLMISPTLIRLIFVLIFLLFDPPNILTLLTSTYFLSSFLVLAISTYKTIHYYPSLHEWRLPKKIELKQSAQFALLNLTASSSNELDKTIALKLLPSDQVGIYSASSRILGALTLPISGLMLSALPKLFRIQLSSTTSEHNLLIKYLALLPIAYGITASCVIWFLAPHIEKLFPDSFSGISNTIQLFCLVVPGMILRISGTNILLSQDKVHFRILVELIGLSLFLLSTIGMSGQSDPMHRLIVSLFLSEWTIGILSWIITIKQIRNKTTTSV